jgi:uncharacterized RDD family membrane protein YckC
MSHHKLHNAVPAPLGKRLLAALYDWLLVLGIMMVISVPAVAILGDAIEPGNVAYRLGLFAVAGAFFVGFWTHGGQTLGMRAWHLQLVCDPKNGQLQPVSYRRATLRFACAWIAALPVGLGFWWALIDKDKRGWHDRLSGTRLIVLPKN